MSSKLSDFIDIHVHILPNIDDGPKSIEQSIALSKMYMEAGIMSLIATPHFIPGTGWSVPKEIIIEKVIELNTELQKQAIPLQIFTGMEIALHNHILESFNNDILLPLANSEYYLIELPFNDLQKTSLKTITTLLDDGKKIILAHPERTNTCQENPSLFSLMVQNGLKIQVNLGSLLGYFGLQCFTTAMKLIDSECVHFIGSDAHSATKRTPPTQKQWADLKKLVGEKTTSRICITNPALFGVRPCETKIGCELRDTPR